MPAYSFDTSALAKRYIVEVGSSWVQAIVAQQSGQTIYMSVLTQPEIVNALQYSLQQTTRSWQRQWPRDLRWRRLAARG